MAKWDQTQQLQAQRAAERARIQQEAQRLANERNAQQAARRTGK